MARTLTWYPPSGAAPIVLNDRGQGRRVLRGAKGLGRPPVALVTEDPPDGDGTEIRDLYRPPRPVWLPMLLSADTRDGFLTLTRDLVRAMRPEDGDGRLELGQHDGRRFVLRCRYTGGMEGEEVKDAGENTRWWRFGLSLLAPDPWWWAATPVVRTWTFAASSPGFFTSPVLPVKLGASQVLGDTVLVNDGDAPTPARWRIDGPGTGVALEAAGRSTILVGTLAAGRELLVDTTPRAQVIALDDGSDAWPWLQPGSQLWQLPPGEHTARIAVGGATAASRVELTYTPRHETPW